MLSAIVFLLVGIVTTIASGKGFGVFGRQDASVFVSTGEQDMQAVIEDSTESAREDRIASLRKKIAALGNLGGVADEQVVVATSSVPTAPAESEGPVKENRCANFTTGGVVWNSAGVKMEEVEGARLVFRETKNSASSSASSTVTAPVTQRQILAQLPVRSAPGSSQSCISSTVIGITKNGALIRNTDVGAYGSFGESVIVGYALDGFPIYGASNKKTDICGGAMEDGQYRYYIANNRDTIITCYAGIPISL
ncbi:MAG: hypothetical protein RLZZ480_751 [Candidatus Parcubacteria bacterium]|jgi:hypothetical protein